jgi:hypothetical protein
MKSKKNLGKNMIFFIKIITRIMYSKEGVKSSFFILVGI